MFKKYYWKQPIYKNDLINVIINGLIAAILGGILGGLLDYLFSMINFPLSFSLVLICYFVGTRIRKGYYNFHILYPVLSILFLIIGLFFNDLTTAFVIFDFNFKIVGILLSSPSFYINVITPIGNLYSYFNTFDVTYLFYTLLNTLIYGLCFTYAYRLAKGRN